MQEIGQRTRAIDYGFHSQCPKEVLEDLGWTGSGERHDWDAGEVLAEDVQLLIVGSCA
jgi:hypothetical protein